MRRRAILPVLAAGFVACTALPFPASAAGRDVPDDIQRRIEDRFADRFVYPETTNWDFASIEPYAGGGQVVCGSVDYQNAMRKYVGKRHFYAIVGSRNVPTIGIEQDENEDRLGEGAFKMKTLCPSS